MYFMDRVFHGCQYLVVLRGSAGLENVCSHFPWAMAAGHWLIMSLRCMRR